MPEQMNTGLNELLRAWGREAADLSAVSEQIQTILALAYANASGTGAFLREVQACDLLTQSLSAMSDFMLILADAVPEAWIVDIASAMGNLRLGDLATRISTSPQLGRQAVSGELEMFDDGGNTWSPP